jgi:hypothetical protein
LDETHPTNGKRPAPARKVLSISEGAVEEGQGWRKSILACAEKSLRAYGFFSAYF